MRNPRLRGAVFLSCVLVTSCTLEFDECLIEGRCGTSSDGGGGSGGSGGAGGSGGRTCGAEAGSAWLATFGGDDTQTATGVAIDTCDGEVVVVGETSQPLVVHPADQSVAAVGGAKDMFVARFTADGTLRFAKSFGSSGGSDLVRVADVAIDDLGNAVVVGGFTGTVDFGGATASSSMAQSDAFVASYSPDGDLRWVRTFGGAQDDDAHAVTIDPSDGSIWVTGAHQSGTTFFDEEPNASGDDAFVLRMTPDGDKPATGAFLWRLSGTNAQVGQAIVVDADRVYVAGTFLDEIDPLVANTITGAMGSNAFIAAFAKDGDYEWLSTVMGDGEATAPRLTLAFGMVVVSVSVDGANLNACGSRNETQGPAAWVTDLDPRSGDCADANFFGGSGDDFARSIAVNDRGNPVLAGTYTADLITPTLPAADMKDIFVIEVAETDLTPIIQERIDASGQSDDVAMIAFGPSGERVLVGQFNASIAQGADEIAADDGIDGFLIYTP